MFVSWIGIGGNIGDARATFDAACLSLEQHSEIELLNRSGLYHTLPVGSQAGGTFSNAVLSLSTTLSPIELLDWLQAIETEFGRTRDVRWGPRPLDLDLLFVDQLIMNVPRLTLPHPAAWYRRFVLDPLVELVPSYRHPLFDRSLSSLRDSLNQRPLTVVYHDNGKSLNNSDRFTIQQCFPEVQLLKSCATVGDGETIPAVLLRLNTDESADPLWNGVPVADLTHSPGDSCQRVTDFLTSVFDQPRRVGDW